MTTRKTISARETLTDRQFCRQEAAFAVGKVRSIPTGAHHREDVAWWLRHLHRLHDLADSYGQPATREQIFRVLCKLQDRRNMTIPEITEDTSR